MVNHDIPFTDKMITAIREGRKTQTRRIVKLPAPYRSGDLLTVLNGAVPCGITLKIKKVRLERLMDISADDALAEGVGITRDTARTEFHWLWDSLYKKSGKGWDTNPLVMVIQFKVVSK